jgi:HD superfamily phosphohydrolase
MAALLHDCSHGIFSHTSEEIYRLFPEIQACVGPDGKYEGMSPSEVLAALIIESEPFDTFFKGLEKDTMALDFSPGELASLILGKKPDKLRAYQTDIINGPFDADKLDYIARDGHYSGLPLGIDLDRLWYATEIQLLRKDKVKASDIELDEDQRRLVMGRSGINSLEQIVAAKMNLTATLYHHHKVRACDCMVKSVVEYARKRDLPVACRKLETAVDFLWLTDSSFLEDSQSNPDEELKRLVGNIVHRRLLKRALVIAGLSFEKPEEALGSESPGKTEDDKTYNLLFKLAELKRTPEGAIELRRLAETICLEAGKPCLPEEVWIDLPDVPRTPELERTFVNIGTAEEREFRTLNKFIPLEQWGKQYVINMWRGHVFSPPGSEEKIGPAASRVLRDKYNIFFNKYAFLLANLRPDL